MAANAPYSSDVARVVGIGTLVADHVFVTERPGVHRYHGSRGGGSVWNALAHLARAGFSAAACGAYAADGPGIEAAHELAWLGVDVRGLAARAAGHSRIFTQWLDDDTRHDAAVPQENFSVDCAVCGRLPAPETAPRFDAALFAPDKEKPRLSLVCADRLTEETVATIRTAHATGAWAALDLGGTAGLVDQDRATLAAWAGEFDIVAMPAAVASWLAGGALADRMLAARTGAFAITRGADGFTLFLRTGNGAALACDGAAPEAAVADATGAGDALLAALVACALRYGAAEEPARRLGFRAGDRDAMIAALRAAPVASLGGIGARAALPECSERTPWGARLAGLRGLSLDELRRCHAGTRPCWFCGLE